MYECGELQDKQGHYVVATLDDNGLSLYIQMYVVYA